MAGFETSSDKRRPQHRRRWATWHGLVALLLVMAPAQIYLGLPIWAVPWDIQTSLFALALAYGAAAWVLSRRDGRLRVGAALVTLFATSGVVYFALLATGGNFSRATLAISLGLAIVSIVASVRLTSGHWQHRCVLAATCAVAGMGLLGFATQDAFAPANLRERFEHAVAKAENTSRPIETHLYSLNARVFRNHVPIDPSIRGGAVAPLGDDLLIANARGQLFLFSGLGESEEPGARPIGAPLPMDRSGYLAEAGLNIEPSYFRVTDLWVEETGDGFDLYAVHSAWKEAEGCVVLQVSASHWTSQDVLGESEWPAWTSLYETKPCMTLDAEAQGGRFVITQDRRMILSVGDYDRDGVRFPERFGQDPAVDYGKILEIDPGTGTSRILSLGHRNPQGLFAATDGTLWSTEHGPRGGDELNRIKDGRNYGWPVATLGTAYYSHTWPLSEVPGSHEGFEPPVFSWVPSIGLTNLVQLGETAFPLWRGDLLVASLKERSLYRVRLKDGEAIYSERIEVGERIRDLAVDRAGRLALWAEDGILVLIEPAAQLSTETPSARAGKKLFANCAGCHGDAEAGGRVGDFAPNLQGVFGRPIASLPGFNYSAALREKEGNWTEANLDRFLEEPGRFAPGSGQGMPGVADPVARASLIEYLRSLP